MTPTEKAKESLSKLVNLFASNDLTEIYTKSYVTGADVPAKHWSLRNRMIMAMADTIDARGYNQWQGAGRQVKKGSKAFYILAPIIVHKPEDPKVPDGKTIPIVTGFRAVPVFRYEDTEGKEIEHVIDAPELPPLVHIAEKWGSTVKYAPTVAGEYGSFNPKDGTITLSSKSNSTFYHELAHLAHQRIDKKLKPGQDPEQEAIAELSSCVLAKLYDGESRENQTYSYIKTYAKGQAPEEVSKLCFRVINKTEKILDLILKADNK